MKGQAESSATAASSVTGEFETTVKYAPISAEVAMQVKGAVTDIVKTVVEKRHEVDSCIVFLSYRSELRKQLHQLTMLTMDGTKKQEQENKLTADLEKHKPLEDICMDLISQLKK